MSKVSVLITARNEKYLGKTIQNVLDNAMGDIEIIAVLDGYLPDPQLHFDNRVKFIHHPESIGQRQSINEAARIATGKYIMKLDAHCAVDKGFDVKLASDCEYDWTVIPRMYNLDVETWLPKWHKRTDYMYIGCDEGRLLRAEYYGSHQPRNNKMIDDTMCNMGPCWFMHKDRYWELGGLDEGHGSWGQMGVEISCKAWLSGGRQVVNKKTWFAHWFRGGSGPGFPYQISGNDQERARIYSRDLWLNNKWPLANRKFQWLIDKFNPPGWGERRDDLTILFYTANVISKKILDPVVRSLKSHNIPIVSITQEPMDLGINIVTPRKRSLQNIYRQVLIGARQATTKYVALCEDDCIYQREHFDYRPKEAPFAYNLNRWLLHLDERIFSYRKRPVLSQCIADREALIKTLEERLSLKTIPDKYCGEPGCFEDKLGITQYKYETFETKKSNMVVCHEKNTMGRKLVGEDAEPKTELEPYGHVDYWVSKFTSISEYEHRRIKKQYCHISGRPYNVNHLLENLEHYWDSRKKSRFPYYFSAVFPFFREVHEGKKFTDEELKVHPYFKYLLFRMKEEYRDMPSTIERCLCLIKSGITLYHNIKDNGMYLPLDMWFDGRKFNLYRGSRRLAIAKLLGYNTVPVRIFNSLELLGKFMPDRDMKPNEDTINGLAIKQFIKYREDSTDKYWVHSYTSQYDMHFLPLRQTSKKVLEIGVKKGASLLLWKDVFPNAHIYGVDKDISKAIMVKGVDGITLMQGLQEDEKFIKEQVVPAGKFDIIIDDASHIGIDQQRSFKILWDCVDKGGYYVVEDLYRNYVDKGEHNTMTMFKNLIDEMNLKGDISEMHFYYNICFIRRR